VIEYARSVLGMAGANSTEFDPQTEHPCVIFMPEGSTTHMGGTMRLGSRRTHFRSGDCITAKLYKKADYVDERHRHRYEVNPDMVEKLEQAGLMFVGKDETYRRMEILELQGHPYFVGVQFHPEFKSRPGKASAVFLGLILAASCQLDSYLKNPGKPSNLGRSSHVDDNSRTPTSPGRNGFEKGSVIGAVNGPASNGVGNGIVNGPANGVMKRNPPPSCCSNGNGNGIHA